MDRSPSKIRVIKNDVYREGKKDDNLDNKEENMDDGVDKDMMDMKDMNEKGFDKDRKGDKDFEEN